MLSKRWFHLGVCLTVAMAGGAMITGCTSGPRYGTDKTAFQQLTDDLGDSVSLTGKDPKNKGVRYAPRPSLVLPSDTAKETLVEPQQSIASKDNPQWIESPEETRARLVKEADDNSDNPHYRSPLASSAIEGGRRTTEEQTKAYREARAIQKGAYLDQRRYISDPPTEYRQVDDPAKLDDVGEPELKKQKKRKKEAAVAGSGKQWWNLLQ
ncbi:hypothetical protein FZ934_01260 [Rhizobium grahamii]|uniref:Lipoprotein n=1 Tax=Rhizobium grahamii TaxID=1120045 RepID=A0A5Q0C4G8_9HYPH|nr:MULTISPECIES: hypothetical protein [Rhizobium]QFY59194.1 hypothetical protein FZ934_01260 [Rhizobium grahamii]QRM48283.1 hypothetical protein F3Y33_02620 [Rhizobium sp. BG6]